MRAMGYMSKLFKVFSYTLCFMTIMSYLSVSLIWRLSASCLCLDCAVSELDE